MAHEQIQDKDLREFVTRDCHTFVQDLWNALPCRWLPGHPAAIQRAQLKASQLRVAAELGLELPPTLVTNSREEFLDFYNQHNGNIVSKLVGPAFDWTVGYRRLLPLHRGGLEARCRVCGVACSSAR